MSKNVLAAIVVAAAAMTGCANQAPQKTTDQQANSVPAVAAKSGSKFAQLHLGMTINEVNTAIGMPNDSDSHESGKRWIPFYFGNDARRLEALYKNEGCLTYASGNAWGANSDGELKAITVDPTGACFSK